MTDPISTLASATSISQAIVKGLGAARKHIGGDKKKSEEALTSVQDLVQALQAGIIEAQHTALELQKENAELRAEIRSNEEWASERQQYERKKVVRATVWVHTGEPGVYYCPNCVSSRVFHQLSMVVGGRYGGRFLCSRCEGTFDLGNFSERGA